jgi:D-methionine transport system permease protein
MLTMLDLLLSAFGETLYMVICSSLMASVFGIPLGFILLTSRKGNLLENRPLNAILASTLNALRSIPFIILLVLILPLTRLLVGTSIGTTAAIVPLSLGAIPFIARIVESALEDVPTELVEAALSFGATPFQIIRHILWREALPGIINGLTLMVITLVGFSAMAGTVGGGGLGDLGIRYGYQRFDFPIMIATVVVLIILVQVIQMLGSKLAACFNHRAGS